MRYGSGAESITWDKATPSSGGGDNQEPHTLAVVSAEPRDGLTGADSVYPRGKSPSRGTPVFEWITSVIDKGSYLGIFALMLLENLFPPIPSELIMPVGGLLSEQGELSLLGVIVAGTLGSFAGQVFLYYLGHKVGEKRLKRWAEEHGHWVATSPEEIDRAKEWFGKRRGGAAVFLGRLVPGLRSVISFPAGIVKMPLPTFLTCTLVGTAAWTTALAYAGKVLGDNYDKVEQYLNPVTYAVVGFMVVSYLWRVAKSFRHGSGNRSTSHA